MSIIITAYKGRGSDHTITVLNTAGTNYVFQADMDLMRLKIGNTPDTPLFDVTNVVPSTQDTFMAPRENPCTLTLAQADLAAIPAGIYDLELNVVDASDTDRIKHASKGIFVLIDTQGGAVENL